MAGGHALGHVGWGQGARDLVEGMTGGTDSERHREGTTSRLVR